MRYLLILLIPFVCSGQISINGVTDYINFGDHDYYDGFDSLSIVFVASAAILYEVQYEHPLMLISKYDTSGNQRSYYLAADTDEIYCWFSSNGDIRDYIYTSNDCGFVETDTAYYYAFTYDRGECRCYRNGDLLEVQTVSITNIASTTSELYLFYSTAGPLFGGDCYDIRLYSRALSAEEIREIYINHYEHTVDDDLLLWYGPTTNNTYSSYAGSAPNKGHGADGTYYGSPTKSPGKLQYIKPMTMEPY